jgi:alpha-tubulin suppressor-like RCC1 family protein
MGNTLTAVSLGTGRTAKAVSAGAFTTCVVLNTNAVKCWGDNQAGQLGLGDTNNRGDGPGEMGDTLPVTPLGTGRTVTWVAVGYFKVCAALNTRRVKCWGFNQVGQLGLGDTSTRGDGPGEMNDALPAVDLGSRANQAVVTGGGPHTCALMNNGQVKCWGINTLGQLGLGDTFDRGNMPGEMGDALPSVVLGPVNVTVTKLAAGSAHNCAILSNTQLKCWGWNGFGQLGLGTTLSRGDDGGEMGTSLPAVGLGTGRKATWIALGYGHSCAILDNGSVKCWGQNDVGQLGLGDVNNRGDGPGEMSNALPVVNLGTGRTAKKIAVNESTSCAILDNDELKCWGWNGAGQLGIGDANNRGDGPDEMGDALPAINLGTGRFAKSVDVGFAHVCALLDDDSVKCWGENANGQLGLGDVNRRGDESGEMGDALPAVNLGSGYVAKAVSAGGNRTCALLDSNQVKCWGWNAFGQLGLGDVNARGDSPGEMGDALPLVPLGAEESVQSLSADALHACALLGTNQIRCWGNDALGIGLPAVRGDGPAEMGDTLPFVDLGSES